ncbi:MAG: hypothetical protein P857_751 [Candidatus Xenolissoclinum pacificiensis L6]|uniref:Uncharacterized protein n=1 Tax=Candidatus Xenolissoclinum pacificiensis L6 TaxID=1401685 RepID=W2V0U0_9RICK|nr:MAG: hypothetical protein P857_751 [Candidatus Xenolissoclinum pacificiensis L6]
MVCDAFSQKFNSLERDKESEKKEQQKDDLDMISQVAGDVIKTNVIFEQVSEGTTEKSSSLRTT